MSDDLVIGYRFRWGHILRHIERVTDAGPGAVRLRVICGGMQSWTLLVGTGSLSSASESVRLAGWRAAKQALITSPDLASMPAVNCARCQRMSARAIRDNRPKEEA